MARWPARHEKTAPAMPLTAFDWQELAADWQAAAGEAGPKGPNIGGERKTVMNRIFAFAAPGYVAEIPVLDLSTAQRSSCEKQDHLNLCRKTSPGPWHRQETRLAPREGWINQITGTSHDSVPMSARCFRANGPREPDGVDRSLPPLVARHGVHGRLYWRIAPSLRAPPGIARPLR